jgi:putative CocE/NonD family hydrolase
MRLRPLLTLTLLGVRAWAQPATLAGFSDKGAFILYANEERVGRLTFQWKADGMFESKGVVSLAGQSVNWTMALTPDAEGRWIKAVLEEPTSKTVWERKGKTYRFTSPDRSDDEQWPEDAITFEPWTPPLITLALRRFDRTGEPSQTLPVLLLSSQILDANLLVERQDTVERVVNGRRLKLTRWVYAPVAHEYHVLADEDGRVYLASGITGFGGGIGERNAVFVREGYEELRETPRENGPISQAKFEVDLKAGIKVPMRDGVKLSTDLYLPTGAPRAPVILIRTPYKKEMEELQARYFARRGYVVAVQDVRGRFASEGQWEPFVHEAKDGYDAIEWLARQPWSSGKVGMIGASYLGWVQWWAASLHPPHLTALIPNVSLPDPFHNMPFENGVLLLQGSISWVNKVESNATADISGLTMAAIDNKNFGELLKPLPVIDLDKAVLGKESPYWRHWMAHPFPDGYWAGAMFADKLKDVNLPVFHQSGWFDGDSIGSKLNYLKMAAYGHPNQKLTIGPWEHTDSAGRLSAKRDFGSAAAIDLQRDYLRWFDHWLKGMDNGITQEPLVSLFVMGGNRWLHGPTYPLPETQFEKLYLASGGKLSFTLPGANQPPDRYVYDPGDPTPNYRVEPTDRKDILVYTTEPFDKPYTIAGPVSAVLYAASSARDTDWFVHLLEVDQDGKASILWANDSGGHIRARYRNSLAKPELLKPGEIYKYTIDLWHTGVTIAPGHRLRVEVSSAGFPLFDRNLNTGGSNETETRFVSANQTIYHDAQHPSHVLLPVIPEK